MCEFKSHLGHNCMFDEHRCYALVVQLEEATDLKSVKCGFESLQGHFEIRSSRSPTGRGVRLRTGMVWVQIPPGVLHFKRISMNSIERMINEAGKYKSATEFIESQIAVYHGSPRRFMVFHHKYLGSSNGLAPLSKMGFSFTDNIKVARSFGKYIKKVYVILNRPYLIDADGRDYSEFKHTINDKIEYLNKSKYDGIVIRNYRDAGIRSSF